MAQPSQLLTVSGLARGRDEALAAMRRLRAWLARRRIRGAWAYHLEVDPANEGAHAHIWWRGDNVTSTILTEAALGSHAGYNADARRAFVRAGTTKPELAYGFKAILTTRPAVLTALSEAASDYLTLNGGQLVNASQGFWIDWNGEPVPRGLVLARTIANGWSGSLPRSEFLAKWHRAPIASRPA